jgi:hypothetical protein
MTTVTAPLKTITLVAPVPDVVRSCVVLQPSPPPDPGEEPPAPVTGPGIYTPIAPGVTYANLPVAPAIVDTSPDQMIGCIITVADNPQGRLNALFPSAVDGDGVIDRATNDIWVYDGATWNNVGPTPGPTITATTVIPPWNEILLAVARTRTKLSVNALAYALQLLTEPDPITTRTTLTAKSQRVVKVGATDIALAAEAPSYDNPYSIIPSVVPVLYTGNGGTRSITTLPWSPGMVWIRSRSAVQNHALFDQVRGAQRHLAMVNTAVETTGATTTLTSFDANGFTLSSNFIVNSNNQTFVAWAFPPLAPPVTNTSGSITTTVHSGGFYNIIDYTGVGGVNPQTIGHGLPTTPTFAIGKNLSGGSYLCGGSIVSDNNIFVLNSTNAEAANTDMFRTEDATTFTVGPSTLNGSGQRIIVYAFCDVPNRCKAGTYVGDGNTAGQTITVGFKPDFLIVKRRDGTGGWNLIDSARGQGTEQLLVSTAAESPVPAFYQLTSTGFVALRGSQSTNHDLNINASTYIYIAFGGFRPTVLAPLVDTLLNAEEPTVTAN